MQWLCSPLIPEDAGQSTEDCGMHSVKGAVIPSSNTSNSTNHPPKGVTVQTSGKGSISITSTTAIMESTTSGHKNSQLILPIMLLPLNISEKYRVSIVLPQ